MLPINIANLRILGHCAFLQVTSGSRPWLDHRAKAGLDWSYSSGQLEINLGFVEFDFENKLKDIKFKEDA